MKVSAKIKLDDSLPIEINVLYKLKMGSLIYYIGKDKDGELWQFGYHCIYFDDLEQELDFLVFAEGIETKSYE